MRANRAELLRNRAFADSAVEATFDAYPDALRTRLLEARELIFDVAQDVEGVGPIEESLKWGEPSYVPMKRNMGSPIRLGRFGERNIALYFNCNTLLVEEFRGMFGDALEYSKNRAIVLDPGVEMPLVPLRECIEAALTYHARRKSGA